MKRKFLIAPLHGKVVMEQDTRVTVEEVRDVPVEVGDRVTLLMSAEVARVQGDEVDLRDLQPIKIVGVKRSGMIP